MMHAKVNGVRTRGSRTPVRLAKELFDRLTAYGAVAGAAGVGATALAQPPATNIVYSPRHVAISPLDRFELDLNQDGINDFLLINKPTSGFAYPFMSVRGYAPNNAIVASSLGLNAGRLARGASVGSNGQFLHNAFMGNGLSGGPWVGTNIYGFLGFRFEIKGETHYGWALLSIGPGPSGFEELLWGFAYDTVANETIVAGQTVANQGLSSAEPQPNPRPGTLGLLALGSEGLGFWRRRETAL